MIRDFGKSWKAATIATKTPPMVKPISGMRSRNPTMTPMVTARSTPQYLQCQPGEDSGRDRQRQVDRDVGFHYSGDPRGDAAQALRRVVLEPLEEALALLASVQEEEERQREDGDRGDQVLQDADSDVS